MCVCVWINAVISLGHTFPRCAHCELPMGRQWPGEQPSVMHRGSFLLPPLCAAVFPLCRRRISPMGEPSGRKELCRKYRRARCDHKFPETGPNMTGGSSDHPCQRQCRQTAKPTDTPLCECRIPCPAESNFLGSQQTTSIWGRLNVGGGGPSSVHVDRSCALGRIRDV